VPRAVLFDLGPGVIGALRASPLGELFRPSKLVNKNAARATTGPTNSAESHCCVVFFVDVCEKATG
jgi:hypothetical protein